MSILTGAGSIEPDGWTPVSVRYVGNKIETLRRPEVKPEGQVSPYFTIEQVNTFRPILSFLNEKDRDILYLIFVAKKKQKDVQEILERSQPSLCYDIKRIRRRLRFIFYLHKVFDLFIDFVEDKTEHFSSQEMDILILMFYTSSFTLTSQMLGISQVRTRYTYDKCLRRMEDLKLWDAYEIFVVIRSNLNIVKRTHKGASCTGSLLTTF